MLIRSAEYSEHKRPDAVHLKSHRPNKQKPQEYNPLPIISGTSLAGVLRHRAVRIINTLEKDLQIVDDIFGTDISDNGNKEAKASRLIVHESEIKESSELVQSRIAIDRFTGGAMH
ncbi:MAG: RAMP superfamily CRISPR-associated protein, partial [Pseudanabaena sp.]